MGTWHRPSEPYDASKVHEDIVYTAEDDKAIDDWIADHVETTWHSLGTCAMKPREEGGVVDQRLNVFGTENLKCVDLSICPVRLLLLCLFLSNADAFISNRTTWVRIRTRRRCSSARRERVSFARTLASKSVHPTHRFPMRQSRRAGPRLSKRSKPLVGNVAGWSGGEENVVRSEIGSHYAQHTNSLNTRQPLCLFIMHAQIHCKPKTNVFLNVQNMYATDIVVLEKKTASYLRRTLRLESNKTEH